MISSSALAVTLEAAEVAGHRRPTVHRVSVAAAAVAEVDRVMPVMEDTNTNPDTCSLGETISVLNRVGFHQVSQTGHHQESSV